MNKEPRQIQNRNVRILQEFIIPMVNRGLNIQVTTNSAIMAVEYSTMTKLLADERFRDEIGNGLKEQVKSVLNE